MFGLSTWELLIIVAVALIFVGPDQLPKVARTIGKGMRQVRGAMGKVDDEMRKAVREVSAELDDEGHPLREAPYRSPMASPPPQPVPDPHAPPPEDAATATLAAETTVATAPAEEGQDVQAVHDDVNTEPSQPQVEVQSSRRGAGRTMAERDWSEVGKRPVAGQVAQAPPASTSPSPTELTSAPTSPAPEPETPPAGHAKPPT